MQRKLSNVNVEYEIFGDKLKLWACDPKTGSNVLRIQTYRVEVKTGPLQHNQQDISIRPKEV